MRHKMSEDFTEKGDGRVGRGERRDGRLETRQGGCDGGPVGR